MRQKKLVSTEYRLLTYGDNLAQKWCFEWYDENGKRCKKYGIINQFKTVAERYEEAKRLRTYLETGLKAEPKPIHSVVFEHINPYLEKHIAPLRGTTCKGYKAMFLIFDKWLCKNGYRLLHPKKINRQIVDDYLRYLEVDRKLENATYNKHINVIDMLFDYLVRDEVITKSPFQFIKMKPKNHVSVSAFKDKDVKILKELLRVKDMTVYVQCMVDMYAFIRPNEVRNLKLKHIDLETGLITVDKEFSKNKKTQKVAIVAALHEILKEYIGDCTDKEFYLLSKTGKPGPQQISNKYVVQNHNRILRKQGYDISKFKPYSWKHTGNSLAYKNGASIRFLKMQNRHHSEVMTEIYIKSIVPEDLVKGQEQYFDF